MLQKCFCHFPAHWLSELHKVAVGEYATSLSIQFFYSNVDNPNFSRHVGIFPLFALAA